MADLGEAFNTLKFQTKPFQNIDYFFTQRTVNEEQEFLDNNLNRKNKNVKIIVNFLALNIPTILTDITMNEQPVGKSANFDIEIFGDDGYHYKGSISSYQGIIPNLMIQIKGDKKIFININYNFTEINNPDNVVTKKFVNFIEVPKRFQQNEKI
jgi:hypothetical protein